MKKTIVTLLGLLMAVTVSQPVFAAEPDSPGSKMITIQAGGLPGIGGLVGAAQVDAGSPLIIENCVNEATVTATSGSAAGILGVGQSGYPAIQLKNCLNTGEITGSPATAFCAWINKGGSSITNCINLGNIVGADMAGNKFDYYCQLIRYEPGTMVVTNCFDFTDFDDQGAGHQGTDGDWLTDDQLASAQTPIPYLII